MNDTLLLRRLVFMGLLLLAVSTVCAEGNNQEAWVYGKWQLQYDPDGAKTDWIEFRPNGDAVSIGSDGRINGIYIVDGDRVKAVFTWKGRDFIMHFRADRKHTLLKIVTSRSGRPSIYKKLGKH